MTAINSTDQGNILQINSSLLSSHNIPNISTPSFPPMNTLASNKQNPLISPIKFSPTRLYDQLQSLANAANFNESEAQPAILEAFQAKNYPQLAGFVCVIFEQL